MATLRVYDTNHASISNFVKRMTSFLKAFSWNFVEIEKEGGERWVGLVFKSNKYNVSLDDMLTDFGKEKVDNIVRMSILTEIYDKREST